MKNDLKFTIKKETPIKYSFIKLPSAIIPSLTTMKYGDIATLLLINYLQTFKGGKELDLQLTLGKIADTYKLSRMTIKRGFDNLIDMGLITTSGDTIQLTFDELIEDNTPILQDMNKKINNTREALIAELAEKDAKEFSLLKRMIEAGIATDEEREKYDAYKANEVITKQNETPSTTEEKEVIIEAKKDDNATNGITTPTTPTEEVKKVKETAISKDTYKLNQNGSLYFFLKENQAPDSYYEIVESTVKLMLDGLKEGKNLDFWLEKFESKIPTTTINKIYVEAVEENNRRKNNNNVISVIATPSTPSIPTAPSTESLADVLEGKINNPKPITTTNGVNISDMIVEEKVDSKLPTPTELMKAEEEREAEVNKKLEENFGVREVKESIVEEADVYKSVVGDLIFYKDKEEDNLPF